MDRPTAHPDDALERLARVRGRLAALARQRVGDELALANWRAAAADGEPIEIAEGGTWPATSGVVVFERHTVTVPAEWPLDGVRLELDVGGEATVTLHSRLGRERHEVGRNGPALRAPTRAFGIRIEARAAAVPPGGTVQDTTDPSLDSATPRLGVTRLVVLDPVLAPVLARLGREADGVAGDLAGDAATLAGPRLADLEARLAALEAGGAPTSG